MIFSLKHTVPRGWRWDKSGQISHRNQDSIVKAARNLFSYGTGKSNRYDI